MGGSSVKLHDLSRYESLGFWSAVHLFHPPTEMYYSIPCSAQEACSAIILLTHFLLDPLNMCNLRNFQLSLHGSDLLMLMLEFIKLRQLFYTLPLTRLCFSGYCSVDCPPTPIALQSGLSCLSHTLTSFTISSDYAFTPGLVQTTVGILRCSPIKSLTIHMVSLTPS
jgi:hypothetical protein